MPANLFDLTGRVALVTGGNKGLGKAMARGLAESGADVVIASRHGDELKAALAEILDGTGRRGAYHVADMSVRSDAQALAQFALDRMGKVDILINNAGMNIRKPVHELSLAEWRQVIDTNLTSAYLCCHAAYPLFKAAADFSALRAAMTT